MKPTNAKEPMEQEYTSDQGTQEVTVRTERRFFEASLLERFREARDTGGKSLLSFAQEVGVPEATLRRWISRSQGSGVPPAFADLVESTEGLLLLHRIVLAAIFVLTQVVGGGIRSVCTFLDLSGLWRVVAAGYEAQQEAIKAMEEAMGGFGREESARLGAEMAPKEITVARDETFHDKPCLVAMETTSNYILLEEYAEDRRTETWKTAMERGLEGLPVKVIQAVGDEGASLQSLAREQDEHSSPDTFHPHQDISRATSLALGRQIDAAEKRVEEAVDATLELLDEERAYHAQPRGPGRPRDFAKHRQAAEAAFSEAAAELKEVEERRTKVREAARGISESYHPFDLKSGAMRSPSVVQAEIDAHMKTIKEVATAAELGQRAHKLLDKAGRVTSKMGGTIEFVFTKSREKISALNLVPGVEDAVWFVLMPMLYLQEVLRRASTAEARASLRSTIAALNEVLEAADSPFAGLAESQLALVRETALWCAQLFQRSSSMVEGRNGWLALMHHSLHCLSPRKLEALTVVHNFFIVRPDGTTAARRFFGQDHRDLFEHLLAVLPPPKRPAAPRSPARRCAVE